MALSDVIASFATNDDVNGVYVVTRRLAKVVGSDGIFVAPSNANSTFPIVAVREPATGMQRVVGGRDMIAGEQGQYVTDVQVIWSVTPLYTRTAASPTYNPLYDPDLVVFLGGTYEVFRTEQWEISGDVHYRVVLTRLTLGAS